MFLIKQKGKKENKTKKEKEKDISIIPQVPVASLVFLPYYKYVLFAGHLRALASKDANAISKSILA